MGAASPSGHMLHSHAFTLVSPCERKRGHLKCRGTRSVIKPWYRCAWSDVRHSSEERLTWPVRDLCQATQAKQRGRTVPRSCVQQQHVTKTAWSNTQLKKVGCSLSLLTLRGGCAKHSEKEWLPPIQHYVEDVWGETQLIFYFLSIFILCLKSLLQEKKKTAGWRKKTFHPAGCSMLPYFCLRMLLVWLKYKCV